MTRVKICGITRPQDGLAAAHAGADAIGLVFYAKSPRNVSLDQAASIVRALPPFVSSVALFVNPQPEQVAEVLRKVRPDLLQFHGEEPPEGGARPAGDRFVTIRRLVCGRPGLVARCLE
jgi:phosphoribosylanthranilate isomerase